MVRRERDARSSAADERASSSCASPAGESPVPVSAEAPGSRSQARGEIPVSRAGRRKPCDGNVPLGGEQVRGPQHEVKSAASTEKQSESRTAHVTVKAIPHAPVSDRARGLGGVQGAARVQGEEWNTRGPSAQPPSRQGVSYKPRAKASAAQRESEGRVVPLMVATNNAIGGKGPYFGHARNEGKREGMAAKSGPNNPDARTCVVQVRQPQCELWATAERRRSSWRGTIQHAWHDAHACVQSRDEVVVHAASGRPSVSRVREIRTHGLKGGPTETIAATRSGR